MPLPRAAPVSSSTFEERLPPSLRAVWAKPVVFPVVFAFGFVCAFTLFAVVLWREPGPARLIASGRADEVLARFPGSSTSPEAQLWRGRALRAKGDLVGMLRAYQTALAGDVALDDALDDVIGALGDDRAQSLAVGVLAEWRDNELDERLSLLARDGNGARRHGALLALQARPTADGERRLRAAVVVAVTDVRSEVCAEKAKGVAALAGFARLPAARSHLVAVDAWKAVFDQDAEAVFQQFPCLDRRLVKDTDTSLAAIEKN
jgi:hypothetical protein